MAEKKGDYDSCNFSADEYLGNRTRITLIKRILTDFYLIICYGCFK